MKLWQRLDAATKEKEKLEKKSEATTKLEHTKATCRISFRDDPEVCLEIDKKYTDHYINFDVRDWEKIKKLVDSKVNEEVDDG